MRSRNYQPPQPEAPSIVPEAPPAPKPLDPIGEARRIIIEARAAADILRKADKHRLSLIWIDAAYSAEQEMLKDHAARP
jgi:hypothetical protein